MQPAILIPAYEPDQPLVTLVKKIRGLRPDQTIIVINDGSSKDKQPIFDALKQYDVDLLSHPINLGKGQALKTGFMYYLNHYAHKMPGLVTADADGQHHPKDILKIVDQLAAAPNVLFLGSRKRKTSVPFRSRFGNTLTRYVFQLFSRVKIYDTQTGLRGIPNHLLFEMLKVSTYKNNLY